MASPQVEKGYLKIATEIAKALSKINLSSYETRVLWFLFVKTYGFHKKIDWITLSQFTKGIDLDRRLIHRTLKKLESKNIIVIYRDDKFRISYEFQKNYEKWKVSSKEMTVIHTDDKVSSIRMTGLSSIQIPTKDTLTKDTFTKEKKDKYLDFVFLTQEEHEKLTKEFGKNILKEMILELDNYIGAMPKKRNKYTDHNRVLRGWVKEKILGNKSKAETAPKLPYYPTMDIEKPDGTEKYRDVSKLVSALKEMP